MDTLKKPTPPVQIPKERRPLVLVLALVAVLALGAYWFQARQVAAREATQLQANGTIEADEVEIGAQRPARLAKYLVAEGESVKAGQVVAVLDTSELDAQLEQARGAAALANARLAELLRGTRSEQVRRAEAQVAQAQAAVEGARRTMENSKKGYSRRTQLRQTLDAAVAQRDVARASLRSAEASLAGAGTSFHTAQEGYQTTVELRQSRDLARQQLEAAQAVYRSADAQLRQLLKGTRSEQLRQAEAGAGQAAANVVAASRDRDNALSDLARARTLHAGNALSDQLLESAETRADTARARYDLAVQAKAQSDERLLELRNGARPEEIDTARAAVQQARASVEGGQRALQNAQQALTLRLGARGQVEGAQTQRLVANATLASARSALAGAELTVQNARTAYNDALQEKQSADAALQQYETAKGQLQAAQAQLDELKHGATREQIEQARGQYIQARGALALARAQKNQSVIRTPSDGVITKHVARVGEVVNPGATVAKLVPLNQVYLTVYVPDKDMAKVKIGQRVEVKADTYRDKVYPGHVTWISDTAEFTPRNVQTQDERVKLVFEVKVTVDNAHGELKPGMPADAVLYLQ